MPFVRSRPKTYRPISYFFYNTPPALQGLPACVQTLDCFDLALKAFVPYTDFAPVVLHTQQGFVKLLSKTTIKTISAQHMGRSLFDPRVSVSTNFFQNALTPK